MKEVLNAAVTSVSTVLGHTKAWTKMNSPEIMLFAGIGAGIGIGVATNGALGAIARQPEEAGNINKTLLLGCALAEATSIYGLVVAILLIVMK